MVGQDLIENIYRKLPAPPTPILFGSQGHYCEKLHAAIKEHLGIQVVPLYRETSSALQQVPPVFADDFCCISHQPTGLPDRIYLDFKKPRRLPPDVCSWLFFGRHRDALRPFLLGAESNLDDLAAA